MRTFGEILRELRIKERLTQKELAQELFVTVPTLSHWECGYQEPSFKDLVRLCKYFDVSADYMLGMNDW